MPETPPEAAEPHATDPVHPSVRRERSDANIRSVLLFGAVLVAVAVFVHLVLWGMFRRSVNQYEDQAKQHPLPPVARDLPRFPQDLREIPPPRLQVRDVEDLRRLRDREDADLYGPPSWVDREKGVVRVPIQDAMQLLADARVAEANGARTLSEKGKKP